MFLQIRAALVSLALLTAITGGAYPLLVTGVAQVVFPHQANGSLIVQGDKTMGSELIGQSFDDPRYFWGRLSATTDSNGKALPYNAASSVGSNLGPTNPALVDEVSLRIEALRKADPDQKAAIPIDLVTSSGSGLDPDISPAAAVYQIHRVAAARRLPEQRVADLVRERTSRRQLGILGEPRVNVLELNLDLDRAR